MARPESQVSFGYILTPDDVWVFSGYYTWDKTRLRKLVIGHSRNSLLALGHVRYVEYFPRQF